MALGLKKIKVNRQVIRTVGSSKSINTASVVVLFTVAIPAPRNVWVAITPGAPAIKDLLLSTGAEQFSVSAGTGTERRTISGNTQVIKVTQ